AGLDIERNLPAVRSKSEVVSGEVQPRECVIGPAVGERLKVDFPLGKPVGALEKHVLEKMRLARLAQLFVARAHPVPDYRGNYGLIVQLFGKNRQAVGKYAFADASRQKRSVCGNGFEIATKVNVHHVVFQNTLSSCAGCALDTGKKL